MYLVDVDLLLLSLDDVIIIILFVDKNQMKSCVRDIRLGITISIQKYRKRML